MRIAQRDEKTRHLAADLLERAANSIEEWGWVQRQKGSRGGGFCVSGAITYAAYRIGGVTFRGRTCDSQVHMQLVGVADSRPFDIAALVELGAYLMREAGEDPAERSGAYLTNYAIAFNDEPTTTKVDVLAALRKAALALREVASDG